MQKSPTTCKLLLDIKYRLVSMTHSAAAAAANASNVGGIPDTYVIVPLTDCYSCGRAVYSPKTVLKLFTVPHGCYNNCKAPNSGRVAMWLQIITCALAYEKAKNLNVICKR